VHLWNKDNQKEPKWFSNNEAPEDIMREYADMYLRVHVGLWFGDDIYVYLHENSEIKIKGLFNHIILNYKKKETA